MELRQRQDGAYSKTKKIRPLTTNNKTGDSYGITIPRAIAYQFQDVYLTITTKDNRIILESGAR